MFTFAPMDVASATEADKWICDGVDETGGIDILYNNAGGARFGSFDEFRQEERSAMSEMAVATTSRRGAWHPASPTLFAAKAGTYPRESCPAAAAGARPIRSAAHLPRTSQSTPRDRQ